jgi:hypothetical protein
MIRKLALPTILAFLVMTGMVQAASKANPNITGWEKGGEYDRLYDVKEGDTLKGRVVKIMDITPINGMAVGVGLQLEDKKDKTVEIVHLGPKDFVDLGSIGLKVGDEIKVVGVWADLDSQDVLMAIKVKKGEDTQLKVRRSKDGFPYWSMTPEERQRETSGD